MKALRYVEADAGRWDALVGSARMATFLHTRKFLAYHAGRFEDFSLMFEADDGDLCGVLPAARSASESAVVVSHPGATYGGLVYPSRYAADMSKEMLTHARAFYRENGFQRLVYKAIPAHLQSVVSQADTHALWSQGASLCRRDLWNVVDLVRGYEPSRGRASDLARARRNGVRIGSECSEADYRMFHPVLRQCLLERHSVEPVHELAEMLDLQRIFPGDICLWLAQDQAGHCTAGCWVFKPSPGVWHTQYIAWLPQARETRALDYLLSTVMDAAKASGARYFSFGASTEDNGRTLNAGLFNYKARFGFGSVAHDFYEIGT